MGLPTLIWNAPSTSGASKTRTSPWLFDTLRGIIDDRRAAGQKTGHFLLLGSAALDLMRQASETLAGRVEYIELAPIDALEFPESAGDVERLWIRGGFPESLLAANDTASMRWRRGRYIDLLVDLLLVRRLRPWSGNVGKRLVRTPKTYIRDSGLTHALLDLEHWDDVLGHPVAGPSWEGFVIENLIAAAGDRRTPYYYRTEDGAEIDLLFERGGIVEMILEIKRSTAPVVSKGFRFARETLKPRTAYLLHGAGETWPAEKGITAISLKELMSRLVRT
jgi:predicted AAA+ superfamily ATPase